MRDHDDQTVLGHLLEQLHNLHGGVGVQRAGRLVGQHDVRVVDQCASDSDALHLSAGQLVRLLVHVGAQPHLRQGTAGTLTALGPRNARDGQRQFHVGQDALVRDEVVALEDEADGVVAVGVPVAVAVLFGGGAVDHQITGIVAIQTANDVEQRGLAGPGGTEDSHELVVAQVQRDAVQRLLYEVAGLVLLVDVLDLQHHASLPSDSF